MKKTTVEIGFLLIASLMLIGCSDVHYHKGNKAFERLSYYRAIDHFEKYLSSNQSPDAQIKLAESYRQVNNYQKAEAAYSKVVTLQEAQPIHHFYLGRMLMANGKYKEAEKELQLYAAADSANDLAGSLCNSCNKIDMLRRDTTLFTVSKLNLKGVESAFAQTIYNKGIVFTAAPASTINSSREPWTGNTYFNLYYSEKLDTSWKEPDVLKGDINMDYHEGAAVFSKDGKTVYFTRSNYIKNNKLKKNSKDESNLKIFRADFINGKWVNLYSLPFNSDDYSVGHPTFTKDEKYMFFISDMPGGAGGTDIYYCSIDSGKFSTPKNLGNIINTPGNEMFPYYNAEEEALYFSSEGHLNMGGLDIFKTKFDGKSWSQPENMEAPVNSSKDDFAFIYEPKSKSGYLSSNRTGTDQIYQFIKNDPVLLLAGTVTLKGKNIPLSEVIIKSRTKEGEFLDTMITDAAGKYRIKLRQDVDYMVYAAKEGYFTNNIEVSTKGKKYSETIKGDIELDQIIIEKPIVLENIYYDLNKWDIRPDAGIELDKLVTILNDNPSITIELSSHTDSRAGDQYNLKLSAKRAQAAVDYIISKGITASRITSKGYGETELLNNCGNNINCPEEEHQKNRRTEFKVLKINKEQITKTN